MKKLNIVDFRYAIDNGIIDVTDVQKKCRDMKRKDILEKHKSPIKFGKDGYWHTRLYLSNGQCKQIKRKSQEDVENVVITYIKDQLENPTIQQLFDEWNDRQLCLKNIKESTHLRNKQTFERHYSNFGENRIKNITVDEWTQFFEEQIAGHRLTAKAFGNFRGITRGFLTLAHSKKWIDYTVDDILVDINITKRTFKKTVKKDQEDSFSLDEYYTIVDYLSARENRTVHNLAILLMFVTGLRVGELVSLRYSDIDQNIIHVSRTETRFKDDNGKYVYVIADAPKTDAGVRDVPIPNDYLWIIRALRSLNPFTEYIFLYRGIRITTQAIRKKLYAVCNKLEISPKSPHKARKTYASILIESGVPEYMVKRIMGHTDSMTTEKYYHRKIKFDDTEFCLVSKIPAFMAK